MKKIFKILTSITLIMLTLILTGCGTSANANISTKVERTMNNLSSTIKKIGDISEEDLIVNDIMPTRSAQISVPTNYGNTTDRQIVNYNQQTTNEEGYAYPNSNTYYPSNTINNVNTFANPYPYNGYNYGNCLPNGYYNNAGVYPTGYNYPYSYNNPQYFNYYNGYNYPNRVISNVNSYNLNSKNIDTYKNAKKVNYDLPNDTLQNYFSKLSNLYSVAANVVNTNDNINSIKNSILAKISSVKTLATQIKNKEQLSESEIKSINTLLDDINTYMNKLNFTKNDVRTELNSVKRLKNNYTNNVEHLNSKYVRLTNCLDSRCSYYNNILSCLFGLENCLNGNCDYNINLNNFNQNNTDCFGPNCQNGSDCLDPDCQNNSNNCEDGNCNNQPVNNKILTYEQSHINNRFGKPIFDNVSKNEKINKSDSEKNMNTLPEHPKKDDFVNMMPIQKVDDTKIDDKSVIKDDPYRIMPKKDTTNITQNKKPYKFVDSNFPKLDDKSKKNSNSDAVKDSQNKIDNQSIEDSIDKEFTLTESGDQNATTTGSFYIIRYHY